MAIENGKLVIGAPAPDGEQTEPVQESQQQPQDALDLGRVRAYVEEKTGKRYSSVEDIVRDLDATKASVSVTLKDDFIKEAVEHYNRTGDLSAYVSAKSVNYDEMSDEEVLRKQLALENPALSPKSVERLFKDRVVRAYMLDTDADTLSDDDREELEYRKELLKIEAQKAREKLKSEQAKLLPPPDKMETMTQEVEQQLAEWKKMVDDSPEVKKFVEKKAITLDGEDDFAYIVEGHESIVEMLKDNNLFFQLFIKKGSDGSETVDFDRFIKVAAYAKDPALFEKAVLTHGKSLGTGRILGEVANPSLPREGRTEQPNPEASSVWDAFRIKLKRQQ